MVSRVQILLCLAVASGNFLIFFAGVALEGFRIETGLVFLHKSVQLGEIDICQNGTHAAALGRTGIGFVVLPLLHVSRFQKLPHERQELFVLDAPPQDID